ncbi:MAG: DUF1844 domain-containing protein [Myxococcales bacterium]|nr:DUF1844 domain-containing protein [Myxococcales bacterium]
MAEEDPQSAVPTINFSSFVVSLAQQAMNALGEGPTDAVDLGLAKQTIDLIGLLKDKTEGNLDDEEVKLMEAILYETRMKYTEKSGKPAAEGKGPGES